MTQLNPELEGRLRKIVALTAKLNAAQVLQLRRATDMDGETAALLTSEQFDTVFNLIITTKLQVLPPDRMEKVKATLGECLLPEVSNSYPKTFRDGDKRILKKVLTQMFGELAEAPPPPAAPAPAPAPAPTPAPENDKKATDGIGDAFAQAFDDGIVKFVRNIFVVFQVSKADRGSAILPFALSAEFMDDFEKVLRRHVLPAIRSSRMMTTLATSENWEEAGADKVIERILKGEANNPIFFAWDDRWANMTLPKPPPKDDAQGKKGGGLFGKMKGKKEPVVVLTKAQKEREALAKAVWGDLKAGAQAHGYFPPTEEAITVFVSLLRYDMELLTKSWDELHHLYLQEFEPQRHQDAGREGSFRDGLNKWHNRLQDHAGEFLAMRCFFTYAKCDLGFLKKFSVTHGVSKEERSRQIPYLMEFLGQFG